MSKEKSKKKKKIEREDGTWKEKKNVAMAS